MATIQHGLVFAELIYFMTSSALRSESANTIPMTSLFKAGHVILARKTNRTSASSTTNAKMGKAWFMPLPVTGT